MVRAIRPVVVDTSVVLPACLAGGLRFGPGWRWLAPALMWSEAHSALHEARWRGDLDDLEAVTARRVLDGLAITRDNPPELGNVAWAVADELGLAKTYDAQFLGLARLRGALCVTADARLHRAARRLGFVVDPMELAALGASKT